MTEQMNNKVRLSDTLYARYIAERAGAQILEESYGFIAYRISGLECFIMEMFLAPEARRSWQFKSLMMKLEDIAKSEGCSVITANVFLENPGASNTIIAGLKYGFKVRNGSGAAVLIAKELGG